MFCIGYQLYKFRSYFIVSSMENRFDVTTEFFIRKTAYFAVYVLYEIHKQVLSAHIGRVNAMRSV